MPNSSIDLSAANGHWQRFSAATVRAFHRYGTWLVSLSWRRFAWYAFLLLLAAALLQKLPPFSWTYTEEVVDSGRAHHAHAHDAAPAARAPTASGALPPLPPLPSAPPLPPLPSAPPLPVPVPPASAPAMQITRTPGGASISTDDKSVNISIPGIVIDTHQKSAHKSGVNIMVGGNGIHITTDDDDTPAPAPAAAPALAPAPSAAHVAVNNATASAPAAASAPTHAAAPAHGASGAVEIVVGNQRVRIGVPAGADTQAVRDAVEEARDAIIEQMHQSAEHARDTAAADSDKAREAADQAGEAADRAREASDTAKSSSDDDDDDTVDIDDGDNHSLVRTHTVHYGGALPLLAFWWILGSVLLKVTYKGRIQAEVKAAAATETAEAESLRRQVLEARMAMMQAQVEPHFLFNTLASIDHLIEFDPKRASQMQRNLISLLRASMPSMRSTDSGLRPLDRELAVVRPYLEILKVRMEERLTTEIDVPDGLMSAEFPPMMIQTLVENSIKHGLEPKPEGGHLAVKADIRHGKLCITVTDTGLGFDNATKAETAGTGVGLANIRERLSLLYGSKAALTIAQNPDGGTIVSITVPYTTHSDTEEGAKE